MALKLGHLIGYFVAKGDDYKESKKPLDYVAAKNGTMKVIRNALGRFIKPVKEIPGIEEIQPGAYLEIPKVPFESFKQMVAWFKAVYQKDKTESTIMVFYDKANNNFILWPPKQQNAGASSKYLRDEDPEYTEMCKKYTLAMVNHSHPWPGGTSVSPSGIDDNDEKEAMLYMVVGNVENMPNVYVSTCPDGERMKLNFFDIFENPLDTLEMPQEYKDLLKEFMPPSEVFKRFYNLDGIAFPEEWWAQHSKYTAPVKATNYPSYLDRSGYQGKVSHITSGGRGANEELAEERRAREYYSSCHYGVEDWTDEEIDAYWDAYAGAGKKTTQKPGYSSAYGNYIDDDMSVADAYEEEIDRMVLGGGRTVDGNGDTYALGDIIDATLKLSDIKIGKLIAVLVEEGYDDIMEVILGEYKKDSTTTVKKLPDKPMEGRTEGKTVIEAFNRALENAKEETSAIAPQGAGLKAADPAKIKATICLTEKKEAGITLKPGLTVINKH